MAKKPSVHVSPRDNGWAVVREGNARATSVRRTQAEAAREGRDIARRHETGFLLHGKDGRIREHNEYGSGQSPREGVSTGREIEASAPGTHALGEPATNEEGQTVQRATDDQGSIVETAFNEEGDVVEENPVGSVADLPGAEGYEETTEEEGITKRVVKDESGTLIEVRVGPDGSILDLQIPPGTEKVEETARRVGQAARDGYGQTADQAQDAVGKAADQAKNGSAGGATEQAQNASRRGNGQDQRLAGQTDRGASPGGHVTDGQTARQGNGERQQDGKQAEERDREAAGGGQQTVGRATGRAVQGVQDITSQVAGQAQDLVGGLAGLNRQDEDKGRGGSQDIAGLATRRDDQEVRKGGGQQQGRGQELDAPDAAERKAGGAGVGSSKVEGSGAQERITGNDVKDPSGPATGGIAREQEKPGQAEPAAQGVGDDVGQAAQEAGGATETSSAVVGSASGDADRTAGRSRQATEDAQGGGTLEGRTGKEKGARGVTDKGPDDVHFEMVGEGYADYEVYDQDGERLGKVVQMFVDEDDQPEYVGVETGFPDGGTMLVPAEVISAEVISAEVISAEVISAEVISAENERRVVVSRPRSVMETSPSFDGEEEVTPEFEERIRKHYGLPSLPVTGGRGGPDAPFAEGQTEREVSGTVGSGMRMGETETGPFRENRNGEGVSKSGSDLEDEDELRMRRSEEELRVGTREREAGSLNVRKRVRTDRERIEVPTRREEVAIERVPIEAGASRARIGNDEVRMPVTEDEVVVAKHLVAKEEVRVRKDVVENTEVVEEDLRREEIEVDDRTERRTR